MIKRRQLKSSIKARLDKAFSAEEQMVERRIMKHLKLINIQSATVYIDRAAYSGEVSLDITIVLEDSGVHILANNRGLNVLSSGLREGQVKNILSLLEEVIYG